MMDNDYIQEPTMNPIQKKRNVLERRHSAIELLSIANESEEWKRFYVSLIKSYWCFVSLIYYIWFIIRDVLNLL